MPDLGRTMMASAQKPPGANKASLKTSSHGYLSHGAELKVHGWSVGKESTSDTAERGVVSEETFLVCLVQTES